MMDESLLVGPLGLCDIPPECPEGMRARCQVSQATGLDGIPEGDPEVTWECVPLSAQQAELRRTFGLVGGSPQRVGVPTRAELRRLDQRLNQTVARPVPWTAIAIGALALVVLIRR
jgi:hypothetical protein